MINVITARPERLSALRAIEQQFRQMRLHDESRKQVGADHDHEQSAADHDRVLDGAQQIAQAHAAAENAKNDGAEGADRGGLRRAENAGIDAADGHDEKCDELPRFAHGGDTFAPGVVLSIGCVMRPEIGDCHCDQHVQCR